MIDPRNLPSPPEKLTCCNIQQHFNYPQKPPLRRLKSQTGLTVNILALVHSVCFVFGLLEYIEVQKNTKDEIDDKNTEMILFTENAGTIFENSDMPKELLKAVQDYVWKSYFDENSLLFKAMQERKNK